MTFLPLFDLTDGETFRTPGNSMLGLELGPTQVLAALIERGRVVKRHAHAFTPGGSPDVVLDSIVRAAQALEATPKAAGLAIPGELDGSGRCWGMAELPGFDGVLIAEEVAARLGCPVSIESDGPSAALAERLHGRGRGHTNLVTVLLGERLSAGLVIDGQIRRGRSGFAASIAHLRVDSSPTARSCVCGRSGCLNLYASLSALAQDYAEITGKTATRLEVAQLALRGDEAAREAVERVAAALGQGLASIQNVLDLDAITLVTEPPGFFGLLQAALREALRSSTFGAPAGEVPVLESLLGTDAVLIGAAELAAHAVAPSA